MSDRGLHELTAEEQGRLARAVMRRQAAVSVRVASVFVALVLGVPLVNAYLPEVANAPVMGFTATWLFLGVLIYPVTVALSFYFVARSNRIEAECLDWRQALADSDAEAGR